ncbi:SGNH/GDSL hydrolase family protein [Serratia sp. (in: enterobacteria)]|uniref:SGNH/GDSL hydrolase family protein n=1 Tax=Serratia sp. (in: enterobacteria) TaxID=616 RepID=UPI0028A2BDAF|nr:SGNH/GDSL hydrolase family protein [Serratia sp. (in: enterobacteria)]
MANTYLGIPVPTPTQDPVPSTKIQDHVFAGAKLDEWATSEQETYVDRLGNTHLTNAGLIANLSPLGKAYTQEQAAAAIASGEIPEGGYFFVLSSNGETVADQYKNINGVATFLGYGFVKSKMVTDLYQYLGVRLYTQSANIKNYYVVATGSNAGKIMAVTINPTVLTRFPVSAGQTYKVYSDDFRADYFAISLKTDDQVTGETLGLVSLSGTGNVREFTVPYGSTANFAFMNVIITSGDFDISENVSVQFNFISYIDGIPVSDEYARTNLIPDSLSLIDGTGGQLYIEANNRTGYYVRATGVDSGKILTASGTMLTFFEVSPGSTYEIAASNFNTDFFAVTLKENNELTGQTLGLATLSGTGATRSFSVPSGSSAAYAFINLVIPNGSFDIRNGLTIKGPAKNVRAITGISLCDETAREEIETLVSVLRGKSLAAIGDSLTEKNFRTNKNYHDYVSDNVGGMTVYNYGISGTGYYGRSGVADTITETPDYITVFFGTNDWGQVNNSKPLGTFLDTGTATISGCINTCLLGLITKFYSKKIAVFTPIPRLENWGSNAEPNAVGYTLEQLSALIQRYAAHYSIPCLDLYHESNLPVYIPAGNTYYFTYPGGSAPDGLHPNDAGHIVMAAKIQAFLESI